MIARLDGITKRVATLLAAVWVMTCAEALAQPSSEDTSNPNPIRRALLIGNAAYENIIDLENSVNDAVAVAEKLSGIGYRASLIKNADRPMMSEALDQFLMNINPGDEILFFYAGHGIEIDGSNYLLPTDIPRLSPDQEYRLRSDAFNLDFLLQEFERRQAGVSIIILDACRDNPFPRAGLRSLGNRRGLAQVMPPQGSFVIFSAAAGQAAVDTLGPNDPSANGLFTRHFLRALDREGIELRQLVVQVRNEVREAALEAGASVEQFPSYYDQLLGEFYFSQPHDSFDIQVEEQELNDLIQNEEYPEDFGNLFNFYTLPKNDIARIQASLKLLGMNPGAIDGQFGPMTSDALRRWISENSMSVTMGIREGHISRLQAAVERYEDELEQLLKDYAAQNITTPRVLQTPPRSRPENQCIWFAGECR